MTIDVGDIRRLSASFYNSSGNSVDPTTLTLEVTPPSGTKTTYTYGTDPEVVKNSTGVYQADISLTQSGKWLYRWAGTGTAQAAEEGTIKVLVKRTA